MLIKTSSNLRQWIKPKYNAFFWPWNISGDYDDKGNCHIGASSNRRTRGISNSLRIHTFVFLLLHIRIFENTVIIDIKWSNLWIMQIILLPKCQTNFVLYRCQWFLPIIINAKVTFVLSYRALTCLVYNSEILFQHISSFQ